MNSSIVCSFVLCLLLSQTKAAGQLEDMDVNDAQLIPVLQFTEKMLDNAVNSLYTHKIGSVLKAQKQIVSGIKYYMDFEFKETTCLKNKPNDGVCDTTRTEICSAQVWVRNWLETNKMQLLNFKCSPQ